MKAAIVNAVTTFAQAAAHRHPRCITPALGTPATTSAALVEQQAARILQLDGETASARAQIVDLKEQLHAANNRITKAEGALQLIAQELGLPDDATPPQVVQAVIARIR